MKIKNLVILLSILLSGCAAKVSHDQALDTWVGSKLDSLLISWGEPQSGYSLLSGDHVVEYKNINAVHLDNHTMEPYNSRNLIFICVTRFTVNPSGIITSWSREGNDCKSLPKT